MSSRGRKAAAAAALLLLVLCGALWAYRSQGARDRVLVLGLDGMDPAAVDMLIAEGKLPNFARLREGGAYGRLTSMKPLLSPVVWTTIATGRTPDQHGIGHFTATNAETGETLPVTSRMRKVKALWNILSDQGRRVGVVGWWATWPSEAVTGSIVSDHTCYHFLFPQGADANASRAAITHPEALAETIAPLIRRPGDVTAEDVAPFVTVTAEELARPFAFDDDLSHFKWALATAESYRRIGLERWRNDKPDVLLVYTEATDTTAHLFGHLFRAQGLSGELADQQRRFGNAVEQMYVYADKLVGEYMAAMDSGTTLIVLSDHGFQLGATQDDPSKTRDMRRVSERFHNLEGIVYMYGPKVKSRVRLDAPAILDIAPTVLALAGLPASKEMPGRVLAEGLKVKAPEPRVATYETGAAGAQTAGADRTADPEIMERLKSLGYVDAGGGTPSPGAGAPAGGGFTSPTGERNIAAMHFEAGRYAEAAKVYGALVAQDPKDAGLHTSYAGVLGALGRYDEAGTHLEQALAIDPLNVEAYHNRAVLFERKGDRAQALHFYRQAVRYNSEYEPSRAALTRLTGSSDSSKPRNEAEQKAFALAQAAADDARRGNYPAAIARLDEAQRVAPRFGLLYQYRSNVAYLMGDLPGAIRALERGLEIEPDNALFRTNLDRLRQQPQSGRR